MLGARRLTPVGYCSDARQMPVYIVRVSSGNVTLTPAAATITLTGATPTVTADNNVNVSPSLVALTFTGATPTVTATNYSTTTLSPAAVTLAITGATPVVTGPNLVASGGKTFYVRPNSQQQKYLLRTIEGEATTVRFDWAAKTAMDGTTISSTAWTSQGGMATITNAVASSTITSALITTSNPGINVIKVAATFADGQIDIVVLKIICSAITSTSSDYQ